MRAQRGAERSGATIFTAENRTGTVVSENFEKIRLLRSRLEFRVGL